jgi:hypothetical protein
MSFCYYEPGSMFSVAIHLQSCCYIPQEIVTSSCSIHADSDRKILYLSAYRRVVRDLTDGDVQLRNTSVVVNAIAE